MCKEPSNHHAVSLYQKLNSFEEIYHSVLVLNFYKNLFPSTSFRTKMDIRNVKRNHKENTEEEIKMQEFET